MEPESKRPHVTLNWSINFQVLILWAEEYPSWSVTTFVFLLSYQRAEDLEEAIATLEYPGGNTDTYGGISVTIDEIFNGRGDRASVRNVIMIITDGFPNRNIELTEPEALRAQGLSQMVAVGVTDNVDETVLQYLSSPPRRVNETYFTAADFQQLLPIVQDLVEASCATQPPPTGVSEWKWTEIQLGWSSILILYISVDLCTYISKTI